jgi:hypothetical protein
MMLRRCAGFASIVALAYWVIGCCEQTVAPPPPEPVECTGPITITVTGDTAAVFSWVPDCMVGRVLVYEGDELNEKWGVETFGENIYRSPIRYGVRPPNSTMEEPADSLFFGHTYTVELFRWIDVSIDSFVLLGRASWTPTQQP